MTSEQQPSSAPGPSGASPHRDRKPFVISMIALAVLLFASTEVLLYYRWATMIEPTCLLIIDLGEPMRGGQIIVDGITLAGRGPHKIVVGDHDRFSIPFYLEPGRYTVKVMMNQDVLFQTEVELTKEQRGLRLDLRKLVPPAAPATLPTTAPSLSPPF